MFRDGVCGMCVGKVMREQTDRQECICKGPGMISGSLHIIPEVLRRLEQEIIINAITMTRNWCVFMYQAGTALSSFCGSSHLLLHQLMKD